MLIVISLPDDSQAGKAKETSKAKLEGVINLNTATPEELRLLSGIGPNKVRDILAYRKEHPFRTVEELARIKGIGRKTVVKIRLHLAVSGPTTIQKVIRPVELTKKVELPIKDGVVKASFSKQVPLNEAKQALKTNNLVKKQFVAKDTRVIGFGNHCLPLP
jgi:competence ComEA-like helix-hairpin-helix protein